MQQKPRGDFTTNELPRKVDFFTAIIIVGHCDTAVCLRDLLKPKMSFNYYICASKKRSKMKTKIKTKRQLIFYSNKCLIFRMQFCASSEKETENPLTFHFFFSSQKRFSLLIGLIKLTVASGHFHSVKTRQVEADLYTLWKRVIYSYYLKIIVLLITRRRTHSAFLLYSKLLVTLTMKIIIKGSSWGNGNCRKCRTGPK